MSEGAPRNEYGHGGENSQSALDILVEHLLGVIHKMLAGGTSVLRVLHTIAILLHSRGFVHEDKKYVLNNAKNAYGRDNVEGE